MDVINKLAGKLAEVKTIRSKLIPTYLNTATKIDLQKDINDINNLVKVHHEIYDHTNWESKPLIEKIGYESRKSEIATERDETLKILNNQMAKLDKVPEVKQQPTGFEELTELLNQLKTE